MSDKYCIRCESFGKRTKASRYIDRLFLEGLGGPMPLCNPCIEAVREENEIFSPNAIENE